MPLPLRPLSRSVRRAVLSCAAAWVAAAAPAAARADLIDGDDFMIAGFLSGTVAVYDRDFTFKGNLATGFDRVTGLDFDAAGNVVAVGRSPDEVRTYDPDGNRIAARSFTNTILGAPIDVKVGPGAGGGNLYVGTRVDLREFAPDGTTLRQFDTGDYEGVAVLPGGVLWGGGGGFAGIEVFDITTGANTATLAFDGGQQDATSMTYSAATDTVLLADNNSGRLFERNTDGALVRVFDAPGFASTYGATRGPGGDVFATNYENDAVYRWAADGTFLGSTALTGGLDGPINILWAGNSVPAVPEPGTIALTLLGAAGLLGVRRRRGA